jgi:hypothetical protein
MGNEVSFEGGLPLDWLITPAVAFSHPDDVLSHSGLTVAEKRAILASWASDARAVDDMPWLRQLECGARIPLSEVLAALRSLDAEDKRASPPATEIEPSILASAVGPRHAGRRHAGWRRFATLRGNGDRLFEDFA